MTHKDFFADYSALVRETVVYLKEISPPLLSTKEEWEALQGKSNAPPPAAKKIDFPAIPSFSPVQRTVVPPPQKAKEQAPVLETIVPRHSEKSPLASPSKDDSKIKHFLQRHSVPLRETTLDDAEATRVLFAFKEYLGPVDVIVFACDADPDTLSMIKNLSKSIDQKLGSAKMLKPDRIEQQQRWDLFLAKNRVKLLIASSGFSQLKTAMSHYTLIDGTAKLGGIPFIQLSPYALYAHSPQEKTALWNQICAILKL